MGVFRGDGVSLELLYPGRGHWTGGSALGLFLLADLLRQLECDVKQPADAQLSVDIAKPHRWGADLWAAGDSGADTWSADLVCGLPYR